MAANRHDSAGGLSVFLHSITAFCHGMFFVEFVSKWVYPKIFQFFQLLQPLIFGGL